MYLNCVDCDVNVTIMWIKFEKKEKKQYLKVDSEYKKINYFYIKTTAFSLFK